MLSVLYDFQARLSRHLYAFQGVLRQVPVVGSFLNWWAPLPNTSMRGRAFDLVSGQKLFFLNGSVCDFTGFFDIFEVANAKSSWFEVFRSFWFFGDPICVRIKVSVLFLCLTAFFIFRPNPQYRGALRKTVGRRRERSRDPVCRPARAARRSSGGANGGVRGR